MALSSNGTVKKCSKKEYKFYGICSDMFNFRALIILSPLPWTGPCGLVYIYIFNEIRIIHSLTTILGAFILFFIYYTNFRCEGSLYLDIDEISLI